jgi:hypothetical protein
MANIVIDIASEFTGNKAFKQAETATEKLGKNVKKLAGAIGLAFSAQAVVNFGRLAVRASLDQQAEQNRLNQLLKVGVGATTQEIALLNDQAKALEKVGVVAGGNITQTQSQLATFNLQVSTIERLTPAILDYVTAEKGATASTADFKAMTNGLAQALNGNFGSLTRVGFVLDENTKKQIKSGTETQRSEALVKVLNSTYKDFNKNLRETDAGQMQVLANAAQEATTIIGTGLLDALKAVGKDNSIDDLAASMESASLSAADFIRGLGQIGSFQLNGETKSLIGLLTTPFKRSLTSGPLGAITRIGAQSRAGQAGGFPQGAPAEYQSGVTARAAAAKEAAEAKARKAAEQAAAKLAATQKKTLKAQQDALKLAKARAVFDLQKIQIEAALKGKISEEDKIRLKLMQAIEEENLTNVEKYQKALEKAQEKTKELTDLLATVKTLELKDPFGAWSVDPLTASINALTASMFSVGTQIQANGREWSSFANTVATTVIRPNLTEWSSSFSTAAANAASATASASAALTATTTAASKAAAEAAAASAAAIAASNKTASEATASAAAASAAAIAAANKASADAIAKAQAEAATTLGKLNAETAASTAAAAKAAQDAIDAANKTAAETVAAILAKASAEAAAKAATAAAANVSTLEAFKAAEAAAAQASAATSTVGSTPIAITVNTGIGDPNAIAEEIQKLLQDAANRGVIIGGLYAE